MSGIRILLIEDDADHIALARYVLKKHAVEAQTQIVTDGAQALDFVYGLGAYAQQGPADSLHLILLDLKLPRISGLEVLRRLKSDARTKAIPVVVVSASKEEPDLLQSFNVGISDYIIKPLEYERFAALYARYVEEPHGTP